MVIGIILEVIFLIVGVAFYLMPFYFSMLGLVAIGLGLLLAIITMVMPKSLEYRLSSIEGYMVSPTGTFLGKVLGFVLVVALFSFLFGGLLFLFYWGNYYLISLIAQTNPMGYVFVLGGIMVAPILLTSLFSREPWSFKIKPLLIFVVIVGALVALGAIFADSIPWDRVYSVPYKLYF